MVFAESRPGGLFSAFHLPPEAMYMPFSPLSKTAGFLTFHFSIFTFPSPFLTFHSSFFTFPSSLFT